MPTIKSVEDLKRIREEALQKRQIKSEPGHVQIIVGMGTPGIAAGARDTMKAILEFIESRNLTDITVRQTGNIGLDSFEPIVQVLIGDSPKVTYGKVNSEVAVRILEEHVLGGKVVQEHVIQA